jgi:biuret amidohydrolase
MKSDICCNLEDRKMKRLPDNMDSWLAPDRTAVVCIDMHRGHLGTEPDVTCPAPRARAVIEAHNQFHRACRDAGNTSDQAP